MHGQAGIDRKYRKDEYEDDEPREELYDENGNKIDGTHKKEEPHLSGEELYNQNGNKLDGIYKKVVTDKPHDDLKIIRQFI